MRQKFLSIRCPNRLKGDSPGKECQHLLGGPSLITLERYNYSEGPFVETRFCSDCNTMWRIVIAGPEQPVTMELRADRIRYVPIEQKYLVVVEGRKIKRGRSVLPS